MWPLRFLVSVWGLGFQVPAWPPVEHGSSAVVWAGIWSRGGGVATGES